MKAKEVSATEISDFVKKIMVDNGSEGFKPVAYFDGPLDCVRVIVRDCSFTEVRINNLLTILEANYPQGNQPVEYVGFNIKGVRYLCQRHALGADGPLKLTAILNRILAESPEPLVKFAVSVAFRLITDSNIDDLPRIAA